MEPSIAVDVILLVNFQGSCNCNITQSASAPIDDDEGLLARSPSDSCCLTRCLLLDNSTVHVP